MLTSLLIAWVAQAASLSADPRRLNEAALSPSPPPYPPMMPGGGYDVRLLCPPNALYIAHSREVMLAAGAVQAGPCWDLSAADVPTGLFYSMKPPEAATFEMANTTSLEETFYGSPGIPVALTGLGNVVSTSRMFQNNGFNSPIALEGLGSTGKWTDASGMFENGASFNKPIDAIGDWSAVTDMGSLFAYARNFNQPVTALYTASPTGAPFANPGGRDSAPLPAPASTASHSHSSAAPPPAQPPAVPRRVPRRAPRAAARRPVAQLTARTMTRPRSPEPRAAEPRWPPSPRAGRTRRAATRGCSGQRTSAGPANPGPVC